MRGVPATLVGLDEITVLANDMANEGLVESSQKGRQRHDDNGQRGDPRTPARATQSHRPGLRYARRTVRHLLLRNY